MAFTQIQGTFICKVVNKLNQYLLQGFPVIIGKLFIFIEVNPD